MPKIIRFDELFWLKSRHTRVKEHRMNRRTGRSGISIVSLASWVATMIPGATESIFHSNVVGQVANRLRQLWPYNIRK